MRVGYCRVSTKDQSLDPQLDELEQAKCGRIFSDVASGAKADRPGLAAALDHVREGDVLVCVRLDRVGRSLPHLVKVVEDLRRRGVGFCSLKEAIDTTTSTGRLVFGIFASLAEFERSLISERTKAALQAARARGRFGGRRRKLTGAKLRAARLLYRERQLSVREICEQLGCGRSTLYRALKKGAPHDAPDRDATDDPRAPD